MTVAILFCMMMVNTSSMTGQEVIESMKGQLNCEWSKETVDTFKSGDPGESVRGIAVTFTATMDVLEQAVEKGCNLVITHEPTYYNHLDEETPFANDPVYQAKKAFIDQHKLMIFRFHDHWHRTSPDGIYLGMTQKLGWEDYLVEGSFDKFNLPQETLAEVVASLEEIFPEAKLRVIGDPELRIDKTVFSAGAPGSDTHYRALRQQDVNLLVLGEAREWETVEYVRDASQAGLSKAAIILGHTVSEEAGMEYCARWMETFIRDIPIHFIPAGNPFR